MSMNDELRCRDCKEGWAFDELIDKVEAKELGCPFCFSANVVERVCKGSFTVTYHDGDDGAVTYNIVLPEWYEYDLYDCIVNY